MSSISLSLKLLTIATIVLKRQSVHDSVTTRKSWDNTYDYIVVGAGAAGATIAYRLSEDSKHKVLLLEAGGPQSVYTDIPRNSRSLIDSEYDWRFRTVPQTWFTPYRVPEPRGLAIGGSTTINNMIYNRGHRKDFDLWSSEFGAKGWSYKNFLKYFIKSENNTDLKLVSENFEYHGTSGPVMISTNPNPDPILLIHQKELNQLGIPSTDINGGQQLGTTIAQSFVGHGLRSSTGNAYLEPNPRPNNLHIIAFAFVTKVLFTRINGRLTATGVEFVKNGNTHRVNASREVIICGGAFNSPQILMLSGIGPKDHLNELGISVLEDLPVGKNLQDHPTISIHMLIKDDKLVRTGAQLNIDQLYEVLAHGEGPLSTLTPSIIFYTTSSIKDREWPNTYTYSVVEYVSDLNNTVREMPAKREEWKQYFRPYLNRYLLLTSPHLSRVRSYGSLRLSSADPFVRPIIDPQFLAHPQDYQDLIEKTQFILFFLTQRMSNYLSVIPEPIPGCSYCRESSLYQCLPYIQCLIRETIKTGYHPVGTCRMGSVDRNDVVVDERLRVKNVARLRVCDASVMPQIINANTNPASIAIGEKAADLIKEDNNF